MSEEEESLQSIGLSPSATLVMVPVEGYTAAYVGSQGIVAKTASVGYNVLSAGAGLVTGALGTFLGVGRAMTQGEEPSASASVTQSSPNSEARGKDSSVNVRTLREQEERRNDHHQLYNGNQLNFEPQQDPKDKDD